jgi:hypothetical protein
MAQYSGVWNISHVAQAANQQNWTGITPPTIEYFLVAGGGGGGGGNPLFDGGSGGGGGVLTGQTTIAQGTTCWVTVGTGGSGGAGASNPGTSNPGTNGGNTVLLAGTPSGTTGNFVALGGGGGGACAGSPTAAGTQGNPGGSGGGGGGAVLGPGTPGYESFGGAGVNGQGFPGQTSDTGGLGGSGGGAGSKAPASARTINFFNGVATQIAGTSASYARGAWDGAGAGASNTGNGGSAGNQTGGPAGGSGIAIIRYPDIYKDPVSTTATKTTYAGYKAFTFTSSGSIVF